jgi:hypothetical protein
LLITIVITLWWQLSGQVRRDNNDDNYEEDDDEDWSGYDGDNHYGDGVSQAVMMQMSKLSTMTTEAAMHTTMAV